VTAHQIIQEVKGSINILTNIMEVFKAYPWGFAGLIIAPMVIAIFAVIGGFDSLKHRYDSEQQGDRIETKVDKNLKVQEKSHTLLNQLKQNHDVLQRYEKSLAQHGQRDESLSAILRHSQLLLSAAENQAKRLGKTPDIEKGEIAREFLEFFNKAYEIKEENLPNGKTLFIKIAPNTFRVFFGVPMYKPPELVFFNLPSGAQPKVIENSKFGFMVRFNPENIPVEVFDFSAEANIGP
jgi:hypothetical protein